MSIFGKFRECLILFILENQRWKPPKCHLFDTFWHKNTELAHHGTTSWRHINSSAFLDHVIKFEFTSFLNHKYLIFFIFIFLFVVPPVRLLSFTYPHPRFPFSSLSFRQSPPPLPLRMWPQPAFSPMLYRICTRAQENCIKPVPIQTAISQSLSRSTVSEKSKLLDLCDRLVPDTYRTPNAVGINITR